MANPIDIVVENSDSNASQRKKDHIELALKSKVHADAIDLRFYYEPLLSHHPTSNSDIETTFLGKNLGAPLWISSMTGGTRKAATINKNLAIACGEFKLGMGLGSCRQLLYSDEYLGDFQLRKYVQDQPLYANLGIAQLEELLQNGQIARVTTLLEKLEVDGLIIHVNPFQEWLQPEGDLFKSAPLDTIKRVLDVINTKVIVKEVGQGMGPKSLRELLLLPIEAIDFASSGGTNFALLELLRSTSVINENYASLANIGHSADEMVDMVNGLIAELGEKKLCSQFIISGGINGFLDGYYYTQKLKASSIYGQASGFLKHADGPYETLQEYINLQVEGLVLAKAYLTIK